MNAELIVRKTIKDHELIEHGDKVLLGLSGGPDSLCLFHILCQLRSELGFSLYAFHLNHQIRGAEADADEEWIREHCAALGIPLAAERRDVPAYAAKHGISVEDAGRRLRHSLLQQTAARLSEEDASLRVRHELLRRTAEELATAGDASMPAAGVKIALAHNRDDQAETVLLRLLRGTGIHGLGAMEYMRQDGLIRPLLDTPRAAIEKYCKDNGLQPRIDSSNADSDYFRNRVRLELLPSLESYNPNIKESLVRLSSAAREDDAFLQSAAKDWFSVHASLRDNADAPGQSSTGQSDAAAEMLQRAVVMPVKELRKLHPALFPRVVKLAFAELGLEADISAVHIEALRAAVFKQEGNKTTEFPKGYEAYKRGGYVYFRLSRPQ